MSSSDSVFYFELAVEELNSFIKAGYYRIRAKFGNVFTVKLKDPNEAYAEAIISKGKRGKRLRYDLPKIKKLPVPAGQTVFLASDVDSLIINMMKYPIEVTMVSKDDPYVLGIVEIPWPETYINYLKSLNTVNDLPPAVVRDKYKLFDEYTSKRVAVITLKVHMCKIKAKTTLGSEHSIISPLITQTQHHLSQEFARALTLRKTVDIDTEYEDTGKITTIYSGGKRKKKSGHSKKKQKHVEMEIVARTHSTADEISETREVENVVSFQSVTKDDKINISSSSLLRRVNIQDSIASLVRSQTNLETFSNKCLVAVTKHWSSTSIELKERLDTLNYIFGNLTIPFGNQVYCVGYFTVENDMGTGLPPQNKNTSINTSAAITATPGTATASPTTVGSAAGVTKTPLSNDAKKAPTSSPTASSAKSPAFNNIELTEDSDKLDALGRPKYHFQICGSKCMPNKNPCFENECLIDLPEKAAHLITMKKCGNVLECVHKKQREQIAQEDPVIVDFARSQNECCTTQKVEEVKGGMTAKMKIGGEDPCYCTCECTFGFVKKTTYCGICGGYEIIGDEPVGTRGDLPFPCPIYHKLVEKGKKLAATSSGGDTRKKRSGEKSIESDKESSKKPKKLKKDERFKFNYGYKGIPPKIGHSQCAMPCTGHLYPVPKRMGWLWNADNIPGLKYRPNWRPGAANKHVVRMLRIARYPEKVISKRRKVETGKKKRPLKRPLLIVQKKDGEYIVTMETMRNFTRPRTFNQYPYEDKPVITYTVGRTDEENRERKKRRERHQRRVEREQRSFIHSAFQDMCKEICLKTYQQALGILPFAEDPGCPCYPAETDPKRVDKSASCSCTESTRSSGSVTDDDEWIVEFTPPNAYFNPEYVPTKIVKQDSSTQYTYLDYKVKLLDRYGYPVPRFFIGPNGNQECSDLGGFWSPDHKWLEINVDGFIGPDGRWAPHYFLGPCGETVEAEAGKFQAANGVWLVVGVDGYVNSQGKWCFYPQAKQTRKDHKKQMNVQAWKKAGGCKGDGAKQDKADVIKPSVATWSCFGDASPRTLSQMGIVGHGHDRRVLLSTLERLMADGEKITMPQTPKIPTMGGKKGNKKRRSDGQVEDSYQQFYVTGRSKCKHRQPDAKGIVAMDERGRKTYFTLRDYKNPRPKERTTKLRQGGISLSSFHVPCFSSFINGHVARQQQVDHILQHNARVLQT